MKRMGAFLIVNILSILVLTGCESKAVFTSPCSSRLSGEEVTFMVISDPHYISKDTYDFDIAFDEFCCTGGGKLILYADEILEALIWQIEEAAPDFLIISGDLTCNGTKESHIQFADKLKRIEKHGTCVFVIPGNHDVENPEARNYIGKDPTIAESVSSIEYVEIYHDFGYEEAISRDEDSLSYLVTPSEDLWLLMLDSTKKNDSKSSETSQRSGILSKKTLHWMEQCADLAKEHNARLIASTHHSILVHNPVIYEGYMIDNYKEAFEVFQECNIEIFLTGHIHLQDIKTQKTEGYRVDDIATGSSIAYPNKYGILKFNPENGYVYNSNKIDVEGWAKEKNIEDENLNNFSHFSRKFFEDHSYDQYYSCIMASEDILEENYEFMAKSIATLNAEYFDGYRNEALVATIDMDRFQKELEKLPTTLMEYLKSMMKDQYADNNQIRILDNNPY